MTKEDVEIHTIDEGKKGFLGIFGQRPAVVKVKVKAGPTAISALTYEDEQEKNPSITAESNSEVSFEADEELQQKPIEKAQQFLTNVIEKMGVEAKISMKQAGRSCTFQVEGEQIALLIGKRGQTLNSLQYLTQLVANRHSDQYIQIVVDAENYRSRREETLNQLAEKLANQAIRTSKEVSLEPMPSYERKIIHAALTKRRDVKTYSVGEEPRRHIVIAKK
ncbi:protein jag [Bacillus sp. IB182487]|uniref:RNA-binding protein KhpB n=2 Tax=Metabacillus arenae TaxID=2771434 RepID=A0A926NAM3_9BACI|nr:protein jag [Metabacillus arenae]